MRLQCVKNLFNQIYLKVKIKQKENKGAWYAKKQQNDPYTTENLLSSIQLNKPHHNAIQ